MKKTILIAILLMMLFAPKGILADTSYTILISLDGFRWDYANRGITPNLDNIRSEGVAAMSFKPAYPSVTFPNHLSIITGMYPQNHGLILNYFKNEAGEVYTLGDSLAVANPKWYLGEAFWETAHKNNIKTASYFWPGSEVSDPERRPDYFKKYYHDETHQKKIDGIINWLSLPYAERPKFISLYFHDTDTQGHKFGPNSKQLDSTVFVLDSIIGVLRQRIETIGMKDSINLIVLSDHGMTEVSDQRIISLKDMLDNYDCDVNSMASMAMISPMDSLDIDNVYHHLKKNEKNYKVYLRAEMPEYYHFSSNPFIYPILLIPDLGWSVKYRDKNYHNSKGEHGYPNYCTDMHGIFFAVGNQFKKHLSVGTLNNIDIYPLLCKMYGIAPRKNIDGKAERIEFILERK